MLLQEKKRRTMTVNAKSDWLVTRRDVLEATGLVVAGLAARARFARGDDAARAEVVRFGIVADAHYADRKPGGIRHYRESLIKMKECVQLMNDRDVGFLVELGDFKDESSRPREETTLKYLETIESVFARFKGRCCHVLGNHDLDSISKPQFQSRVTNTGIAKDATYYSFDLSGTHFIVLDANYKSDGADFDHGNFNWTETNIPGEQLRWLKKDLAAASGPAVVFVHQQLDGEGNHTVDNAPEVRRVLEASRRVLAVFQGHNHRGGYSCIGGIHYYTLKAMVDGTGAESSSYAVVELHDGGRIVVTGYRKAASRTMGGA